MLDDGRKQWPIHVAAVLYALPTVVGCFLIGPGVPLYWAVIVPITTAAVFFIYAFGGRYRQWARLFLLASLIEPGLFWALSHVMVLGIDSVNGMLCIMWAVGQISCAIIGATALAGSDAMRIYRAVWTPLYPESVLPQEIAPVEEQEEPGWPRR